MDKAVARLHQLLASTNEDEKRFPEVQQICRIHRLLYVLIASGWLVCPECHRLSKEKTCPTTTT